MSRRNNHVTHTEASLDHLVMKGGRTSNERRTRYAHMIVRETVKPKALPNESKFIDIKPWRKSMNVQPTLVIAKGITAIKLSVEDLNKRIEDLGLPTQQTYRVAEGVKPISARRPSGEFTRLYLPPDAETIETIIEDGQAVAELTGIPAPTISSIERNPELWAYATIKNPHIQRAIGYVSRVDEPPVFELNKPHAA